MIVVDAFILLLIAAGVGVYKYTKDARELMEAEYDFIREHEKLDPYKLIKLEFSQKNIEFLEELCGYFFKWKILQRHPPHVDKHFLGFKEAIHNPFYVEMIHCTVKHTIIKGTDDDNCALFLKRAKDDENIPGKIFRIDAKFCYDSSEKSKKNNAALVESILARAENEDEFSGDELESSHGTDYEQRHNSSFWLKPFRFMRRKNFRGTDHAPDESVEYWENHPNPDIMINREPAYQPEHHTQGYPPETGEYFPPYVRDNVHGANQLPQQPLIEEEIYAGYNMNDYEGPFPNPPPPSHRRPEIVDHPGLSRNGSNREGRPPMSVRQY